MKQIFLLVIIGVGILACNSNQKESVETISFEELIGDSDGVNESESDSLMLPADTLSSIDTYVNSLIQINENNYDTTNLTNGHPMDRYGFNSVSKIKFVGKNEVPYGKSNMVTPKAEFYVYNFSDSIKLNNAFYNWLDCFGSDCDEVKLNQDIVAVKTPPSFTLVYDTTLIDVKYLCEHDENDWQSFQKSIIETYGKNYRYRIDISCGGPLKWK